MFDFELEDGKIVVALDANEDGEPSIKLEIDVQQVIAEAISKIKK